MKGGKRNGGKTRAVTIRGYAEGALLIGTLESPPRRFMVDRKARLGGWEDVEILSLWKPDGRFSERVHRLRIWERDLHGRPINHRIVALPAVSR